MLSVEFFAATGAKMCFSLGVSGAALLTVGDVFTHYGRRVYRLVHHGGHGRLVKGVSVCVNGKHLAVTKRFLTLGTVHKSVGKPGTEVQFVVVILDQCSAHRAFISIYKSAVP